MLAFVSFLTSTHHLRLSRDNVTARPVRPPPQSIECTVVVTSHLSLASCTASTYLHLQYPSLRPHPEPLTDPSHFTRLGRTKTPRAAQALRLPPFAFAFRLYVAFFIPFIHPLHVSLPTFGLLRSGDLSISILESDVATLYPNKYFCSVHVFSFSSRLALLPW